MSTVNETERKYEGRPGHALPGLAGPLVRADEPDSVHQMRVTARRLRSTLQSFGQVIPRSQTSEVIAGHPPPALTGAGANWR